MRRVQHGLEKSDPISKRMHDSKNNGLKSQPTSTELKDSSAVDAVELDLNFARDAQLCAEQDSVETMALSRNFESEMLINSDGKPLMVLLVEACRRIFADCRDLTPEKVVEIRQLMQNVRCSDVGLPETMRLTQIEYIHVLEVFSNMVSFKSRHIGHKDSPSELRVVFFRNPNLT